MKKHQYPMRARYAEVDAMGFVHNSRYLVYFEEARTDMVRELGWPYKEVEDKGVIMPISEAKLKYQKPITYDEEFTVFVWLDYVKNHSVKFKYEIQGLDGDKKATGSTVHAAIDRASMDFAQIPDALAEVLRPYSKKG